MAEEGHCTYSHASHPIPFGVYTRLHITKPKAHQTPQEAYTLDAELLKIQYEQAQRIEPAIASLLEIDPQESPEQAEEEVHQPRLAGDEHREAASSSDDN